MTSPVVSPVVLVNGLPAAGKTTLARALSRALRLPLFSKDTIKEAHADVLGSQPPPGWAQRGWNAALGAAATETMWALLADSPAGAVLESCWQVEFRHVAVRCLGQSGDRASMEIWCEVPVLIARRRFQERHPRHPIHGEPLTDAEWERWHATAQPLRIGPLMRLDTTQPVDIDTVTAWVHQQTSNYRGRPDADPTPEEIVHRS